MSGKGSKRRPAAISEEQLAVNWEAVFGKHRSAQQPPPRKPDPGRVLLEDYTTTKQEWVIPSLAEILGDSQSSQ